MSVCSFLDMYFEFYTLFVTERGFLACCVGNKCFRVVHVSAEADDAVTWNNSLQLCRAGPGVAPNLASVQSLLETGRAILSRVSN